ncbi:MAG: tetratricopeptide repeat protein [Lentisphaeria bacterium]|jgi:tetratricopeptide (TPR) repeat protein|nr:tetratricopeptide repeat protein [Lentisphaeria bacterium]
MRNLRLAILYVLILTVPLAAAARDALEVSPQEKKILGQAKDLAQTREAETAAAFLQAQAATSRSAPLLFQLALWQAESEATRPQAIERLQQALELAPAFPGAYRNLGILQSQTGDYEAAAASLQKAAQDGLDADVLLALGHVYLQLDNDVAAESALRQCLVIRPRASAIHAALAQALMAQQRFAEARAAANRAVRLEDRPAAALWQLLASAAIAEKNYAAAIDALEAAAVFHPDDGQLLWLLADVYQLAGFRHQAAMAYRQAAAAAPDPERAWQVLAAMVEEEAPEALAFANDIVAAAPASALLLTARAHYQAGQRSQAIALARTALQQKPGDGASALYLARWLIEDGAVDEGERLLWTATATPETAAEALRALLTLAFDRQHYAAALKLVDRLAVIESQTDWSPFRSRLRNLQ